jgi:hypothetical protein
MIRSQTFQYDLFINQGSTFQAELSLEDNTKQPFNLNNYTAKSVIKQHTQSREATIEFDCIISDYLSGNIFIALTPEQTATLQKGTYIYNVILEENTGARYTVVEGNVYVSARITE